MKRILLGVGLVSLLCAAPVTSGGAKGAKIMVVVRGAVSEEGAQAIREVLQKVPGIKVKAADVQVGEKGQFSHYFTPPFEIEIADLEKADLGIIAKAVAQAKTPTRGDIPPSLNLVLYHSAMQIQESDISALREALAEVNGMDARAPGGTGGVPADGRAWVRCDDSGAVRLEDIQAALKKANLNFSTQKP